MFSFLSDFIRHAGGRLTVIVLDEDGIGQPRRYRLEPARMLWAFGGVVLGVGILLVILVVATPVKGLFPGLATEAMQIEARTNAVRLESLEDSLAAQDAYLAHLRDLVMGRVDPGDVAEQTGEVPGPIASMTETTTEPQSENWTDHQQPALPVTRMPVEASLEMPQPSAGDRFISALRFPVLPPVTGVFTRGFDARGGHYAVDYAASEGTVVRSVGDGYTVFADWTHDGGHVVIVQHANGFVSVYKHNQRLLKRVGDRVRDREAIALSGNTGEITTGPHLHFELWLDGLAQDPADYVLSL